MKDLLVQLLAQTAQDTDTTSYLDTLWKGGPVGYLIMALSIVALALIVTHFAQIRRKKLLPDEQLNVLENYLAYGQVQEALEYCVDPLNDSFLTRILAGGLLRYQRSAFGPFELKNALEEAGEDQSARLYRSTDALGVIGTIAPLLGLLGTVLGMVGAFETIGNSSSNNHELLAANISEALVTTLLGLILAIPCVALFSYFRNRIDGLSADTAGEIERLVLHLEESRTNE
ncbi:MAG: MotA/TolQ/ExbB proton channel family protein [Phycisphaerales bacterium]|jgi:biopolymer transport protein ExbB|nr:MotA/TolQ/ExbB proton channel family protein [Phycisphaerales bacterium]